MIHTTPVLISDESTESTRLESERLRLLKSIQEQSRDAYRPETREVIKLLREEYNRIVNKQVESNRGPWTDPLALLPLEIWVQIIQEIVDWRWSSSYRVITNMILVSEGWKEAIVNTPLFWTAITIDPGIEESDLLQRTVTSLHLSKDKLLTVIMEFPMTRASYESCQVLLSPHSSRIRQIIFRSPSRLQEEANTLDPSIHHILSDLLPLPKLQEIQFSHYSLGTEEKEWNILELTPEIRILGGSTIPFSVLRCIPTPYIESLKLNGNANDLFPLLPSLSRLKKIDMNESSHTYPEEDMPPVPLQAHPLGLEVIRWRTFGGSRLMDVLRRSPRLERLTLQVKWASLSTLFGMLDNFPHLSYLSISLPRSHSDDQLTSGIIAQSPSLREFHLELGSLSVGIGSEEKKRKNTSLSYLIDSCIPIFEKIKSVSLTIEWGWVIPTTLWPSLTHLRVLNLTLDGTLEGLILTFEALEDLQLTIPFNRYVPLMSNLRCPNLLLLTLRTIYSYTSEYVNIDLDAERFPKLSRLHWNSSHLGWNISSHSQLKTLIFMRGCSPIGSNFCEYLILRPGDFPSLEQVEFHEFPEWDLVFLMLERRNFLLDPSISRIRTLVLPTTLGFLMKTPLTLLLGGQFANRLSNHDLSIAGIGETYFDKSLYVSSSPSQ
ncbi:hypothetical protein FRC17_004743 [Serendipita sp. 399]|nr:hypothetical protein FRC17_004743 [Serendipita sp. 399]